VNPVLRMPLFQIISQAAWCEVPRCDNGGIVENEQLGMQIGDVFLFAIILHQNGKRIQVRSAVVKIS